jgi:hypothetical protein
MAYLSLIAWFTTILPGLYMLTVWLIERDVTDRSAGASRLPVPVVCSHLLLALTGLGVWVAYLVLDRPVLAWVAVAILALIALLGVAMFARWIPVYREPMAPAAVQALPAAQTPAPEGAFPFAVVLGHGLLATTTIVLVVLTALGVGGS